MKIPKYTGVITVVIGGVFFLTQAHAETLNANLKVFKIEAENKKKELTVVDEVQPNTLLEYQVIYSNVSNDSLKNLKLNLPLPAYVTYTGISTPNNQVYASLDGINFSKAPLKRVENGKTVKVPYSEYRVLQWNVSELKAKQSTTISAQTRVNNSN
jgi:hypothetical protein